jgi:hypothetical protein
MGVKNSLLNCLCIQSGDITAKQGLYCVHEVGLLFSGVPYTVLRNYFTGVLVSSLADDNCAL